MVFRYEDGCWSQLCSKPSTPIKEIKFLSDQYFEMVFKNDKLGNVFALGPDVSFMKDGVYFKVIKTPAGEITEGSGSQN